MANFGVTLEVYPDPEERRISSRSMWSRLLGTSLRRAEQPVETLAPRLASVLEHYDPSVLRGPPDPFVTSSEKEDEVVDEAVARLQMSRLASRSRRHPRGRRSRRGRDTDGDVAAEYCAML